MTTRYSRHNRDAGLRRIGAITGWTVAGALAGTGLFAGLAAQSGSGAAAGRVSTRGSAASTGSRSTVATVPTNDFGGGNASTQTNQAPAPIVSQSNGFAPIVSGAS